MYSEWVTTRPNQDNNEMGNHSTQRNERSSLKHYATAQESGSAHVDSYLTLLALLPDPSLLLDRQLHVLGANAAMQRVSSLPPAQMRDLVVSDLGPGFWKSPALHAVLDAVIQQQQAVTEMSIVDDHPDGSRTLLLTARPLEDGHLLVLTLRAAIFPQQPETGAPVYHSVERRQLDDLFMRAPVAIAILRGPQYTIELANPAICEFWGRSLEELLHRPVFEVLPEATGQGYEELLGGVLTTGVPYQAQEISVTLRRKGRLQQVSFNVVYQPSYNPDGSVGGIIVIANDVTEQVEARVRMEQLVAQVEQQAAVFDTTLTAISDFVYTFDIAGRFTYANRPLLQLLGITLEEIVGKTFHDLPYPPELATVLQQQIEQVVTTRMPVTDETPYTSPTGQGGYYEYIFMPVYADDGRVVLVAGSTRDITARKEIDRQKDEFIGVVSHELRTPVTSIKAFTQMLQRRFNRAGDPDSAELLGKLNIQITRLTSLINDLLDVTKLHAGQLQFNEEFFAFDGMVGEVVEEIQRTAQHHRIERIGRTNATIFGDPHRIAQVLTNLLTNAIKYSPHADRIRVASVVEQESVMLSVQDFGVGIPQDRQGRLFERFYRVQEDETIPGIGLGLYISAEIMRRQRGTLWVESEEGVGSIFSFRLPLSVPVEAVSPDASGCP